MRLLGEEQCCRREMNVDGKGLAMCTSGIDVAKIESMIDMIDDHVALEYRWAHKVAHMLEEANATAASEAMYETQRMFADARSALAGAKCSMELGRARVASEEVSAHLV